MLQVARGLADAGADVEILTMNPTAHRIDAQAAAAALAPILFSAVAADPSRRFAPIVRALVAREPYVAARFFDRRFEKRLVERLRGEAFDVVQIESPFLSAYLPAIRRTSTARVALRSQNVEFRIWEMLARHASGLRAAAYRRVARSLRQWEVAATNRYDAVLPITEEDAADFRVLGVTRPMHVVPSGMSAVPSLPSVVDPNAVYFIGSMGYRPNLESAEWILASLWPVLRRRVPEVRLTLAGSNFPDALARRALDAGIDVQRDVPDVMRFAAPYAVMIAPVFSGGGIRIKALEAAAMGKAIVALGLGTGGLDLEAGEQFLEATDAESFTEAIVRCVRDPEFARGLGEAARLRVVERYDATVIGRRLLAFYGQLCESAS